MAGILQTKVFDKFSDIKSKLLGALNDEDTCKQKIPKVRFSTYLPIVEKKEHWRCRCILIALSYSFFAVVDLCKLDPLCGITFLRRSLLLAAEEEVE